MRTNGIAAEIGKGIAAGAAASYLMNKTTTWLYENESPEVRQREDAARGDQSAYVNIAEKLAGLFGASLDERSRNRIGTALHWTTGIAGGVQYAVMRRKWPRTGAVFGLAYGATFFLVVDELMNPVLGSTPGPAAFPWETHARGLAGHLVYGAANEAVLRSLDRV